MDRLRLAPVSLVPEISLLLAEDATILWARLEAEAGHPLPPPFWASAWSGGQAVSRYILDNPDSVAGRRVLDLASGSGMVAIAAAKAGAATVVANDVDPYALAAIDANAHANGVRLRSLPTDLLDGDGGDAEVVLAGDALYNESIATRVLAFLARVARRGTRVLIGDPDRGHVPYRWLESVARYSIPTGHVPEDHQIVQTIVLRPRAR